VRLFPLSDLPPLAFDHAEILAVALAALGLEDYRANGIETPSVGVLKQGFCLSDEEYARLPERCLECCDLRRPDLRYAHAAENQELHVICPCCRYFRHNQEEHWRASDDWAGGLCETCRSPLEVGKRAQAASLRGRISQIEEEIASLAPSAQVLRFATLERAREDLLEELRTARPRCDGSY